MRFSYGGMVFGLYGEMKYKWKMIEANSGLEKLGELPLFGLFIVFWPVHRARFSRFDLFPLYSPLLL